MRYAYSKAQNSEFNIREAALQPYMGITAFLRPNEPWLVVAFDKKGHTLVNRDGNKVKLNVPFDWVEATDRSRLIAALCDDGCSLPGVPHYSFEDNDWFFRVEDDIFEAEEIMEYLAHQTQTGEDRLDERGDPTKCPECGSHTIGNRIAEFTEDGKPIFHCKTCGNKFEGGEHTIVNPKLTYEVDKGQERPAGNPHPYAPGPDNPRRVCEGCGYNWASHHEFAITGGKCPECGHGHSQEDVMAMEGKQSTFENDTQDSMSNHDTGSTISTNPGEYRNTDITDGSSNVTAPVNTFQGPEGLFAVKGSPGQIEGVNWNGNTHGPFSVLPEDVDRANQMMQQISKVARRNFTPGEQQSLIDEGLNSKARNIHKLNLEGTHYTANEDPYSLWW